MQITDVETIPVGTPAPHKGGNNWLFVKVSTNEGIVGWGEPTKTDYRLKTLQTAYEEFAEKFIIGTDPFEIEQLYWDLRQSAHDLHVQGNVQSQLFAGIEMACWDIVGKALDKPVYQLLGGKCRERLRSYTYLHYKWDPPQSPEIAAEAAREYVDKGYKGIKLDPLHPIAGPRNVSLEELQYAEDVIAAIRKEIGAEAEILLGTHGQFDTQTAIRLARRLEDYDLQWFEEPVPPENVDEMARVARSTSTPVATGERISSMHKFSEIIEKGAAQILQLDTGLTGILQAKKIAGMAEAHYIPIAPWHYCGPIQGAANIHLDTCTPNFLIQESIEDWDFFHNELLKEPIQWVDGYIIPPERPGLGVEINEDVAADHPPNDETHPSDRVHYTMDANRRHIDEHLR
jgi:2-dehydro-3-deoxyphosphogalactonate aldolase